MEKTTFLVTLLISSTLNAPIGHLYSPEDDVEFLNIHNFKSQVENSSTAWLVEFYDESCGDCQRFAPKWKKFATDVIQWRDMVKVAVLPCSEEINRPICREFEILSYPRVRYFHENYQTNGVNLGVDLIHGREVILPSLKRHVVEVLMNEQREGRGAMYPKLKAWAHSDVTELFAEESDDIQYVFLVVEPSEGYLGAEVALDLHKTPKITIRHALHNNTGLVANLKIKKFPFVAVWDRNNNSQVFTEHVDTRSELKTTIGKFLEGKSIKIVELSADNKQNSSSSKSEEGSHKILRDHVRKMGDVIFQTDLEAALRYSLQEVSTVEIIKDEKLQALNAYLDIISKYFPFGYTYNTMKLRNLTTNVEEVEGSKIQLLLKEAQFSSPKRFLGCLGSLPVYRRYPCSLWRLFHYFSVNGNSSNPREILDAMHGYVTHFFGCTGCSQHFQQMAAQRNMTGVSSLEESILWLWESHNVVNERLKGDITEDPEYPKSQFPARKSCPECYDENGSWKTRQVLKYLKRMYGKFNVRYIGSDTSVLFPGLD